MDRHGIAAQLASPSRILVLLAVQRFAGQQDGAIEGVRQTAVSAADLHGDDDQLAQGLELAREARVDAGIPHAEAHSAVRRDDLEEHAEQRERVVVCVFQAGTLDDGDEEEAEEDVPQIERELAPQMGADVAGGRVVVRVVGGGAMAPDAEGLFFVDVGAARADGDGEDGDVHHDEVRDLGGGVQGSDVDDGETGGAR